MSTPRLPRASTFPLSIGGNHASFVAAIALTLLDVPAALVGSWIIGEIIDAITSADPGRLTQLLAF